MKLRVNAVLAGILYAVSSALIIAGVILISNGSAIIGVGLIICGIVLLITTSCTLDIGE